MDKRSDASFKINKRRCKDKPLPYESVLRMLQDDQIYIKKYDLKIPRKLSELRLFEELQNSTSLPFLVNNNVSDKELVSFLAWFCSELTVYSISKSIITDETERAFGAYCVEFKNALKKCLNLLQSENAQRFFNTYGFDKHSNQSLDTVNVLSFLFKKILIKIESKHQSYEKLFKYDSKSSIQLAKKSKKRSKYAWHPLLVASAIEFNKRFGTKMPALLADLFNTETVKIVFPRKRDFNKQQIQKILKRAKADPIVRALKIKSKRAVNVTPRVDNFRE